MGNSYTCPECGSTERKQEPDEFALLGVEDGRIQLHHGKDTTVFVVRVDVCTNCGLVSFHESP